MYSLEILFSEKVYFRKNNLIITCEYLYKYLSLTYQNIMQCSIFVGISMESYCKTRREMV